MVLAAPKGAERLWDVVGYTGEGEQRRRPVVAVVAEEDDDRGVRGLSLRRLL